MTCVFCSWRILRDLDVPGITPAQTTLQVGGPYPETRFGWVKMVRSLDPIGSLWLDYAFEAHRITPRVHLQAADGSASCRHPEARLLTISTDVVTCAVCRYVADTWETDPIPSVYSMGDAVGVVGPCSVIG